MVVSTDIVYVCHHSALCAGTNKANSPGERPLATRSPAATAARVNAPTPASLSTNSPNILGPATTSSAIPGPSTSVRAQLVPARTANGLGAASGPAAASGPSTSGSLSFSQPELCNFAGEALEDQDNKEEEDTEDSEDGLLTDSDDLSSWGSDEEIWGSDSDYYETDEDEEALAGQYSTEPAACICYAACTACTASVLFRPLLVELLAPA